MIKLTIVKQEGSSSNCSEISICTRYGFFVHLFLLLLANGKVFGVGKGAARVSVSLKKVRKSYISSQFLSFKNPMLFVNVSHSFCFSFHFFITHHDSRIFCFLAFPIISLIK